MSIILLPHILEWFRSFNINTVFHFTITLTRWGLAYAQNYTSDKSSTNTATGISTGTTNITTESELPSAIGLPALPKSEQFQMLHKKPVPLLLLSFALPIIQKRIKDCTHSTSIYGSRIQSCLLYFLQALCKCTSWGKRD